MKHLGSSDCRLLIIIVAVGLLLPVARGETARKIRLPASGKSLRIAGQVHGWGEKREFAFQGVTGMKLKIQLSGAGPLRGEITFPSGKHTGSPGRTVLDQVLEESGRYRLEVVESPMGESWDGAFNIKISVAQ
ncbi:MAG TPA: hypothetical protein VEG68_19100 [Terriglobales bacterium]|nr:hypothetical protein [Terriglobales bacterium]